MIGFMVILVRPHMIVAQGEGEVAAVDHDILEDVRVLAAAWDAVWRQ